MPLIAYEEINLSAASRRVVEQANEIVAEYRGQGFDLTLRQLYYQFVSRDLIPNNQKSYKRLGDIVSKARMAGLIDWDSITDRTRNVRSLSTWGDPADIAEACARQFRHDLWASQPYRVEVWIEKDALVGVIEGVCNDLRVPYFSCRGYTSQSEMWAAGRRMRTHYRDGRSVRIFHLGDHDPSGIDMSRDIADRLGIFAERAVRVDRLALNMPQIEQYNPPPNPAKMTDSRAAGYVGQHGDESWELDALEPAVIAGLIRTAVNGVRDAGLWAVAEAAEAEARGQLQRVSDQWADIVADLN